jgi:cephalosporin hydroxylase
MPDTSLAAPKKSSRRLYDLISIVTLLATAVLLFYMFRGREWGSPEKVSEAFHKLLYNSRLPYGNTHWLGTLVDKNPLDLWIYQEIIYEIKPDLIVEAGTFKGGSALYMANLMDNIGHGKLITIDIEKQPGLPVHPRIQYLLGSSTSSEIVDNVKKAIGPGDKVMVVLDSDHRSFHVLKELLIYSKIVTKGSYLIVEDTDVNGHPVFPDYGPGPMEALQEYLKDHSDLEIDKSREKFFVTFNPSGYLRKVKD